MRLHYYRFDVAVPEAVQEEYGAEDGIIAGLSIRGQLTIRKLKYGKQKIIGITEFIIQGILRNLF